MTESAQMIRDLWPIILFIMGIIWKQIVTHFEVKALKIQSVDLLEKINQNIKEVHAVKNELHVAIKEQGKETNQAIQKLTEVTAELVATTKVMASEMRHIQKQRL